MKNRVFQQSKVRDAVYNLLISFGWSEKSTQLSINAGKLNSKPFALCPCDVRSTT